MERYQKSRENPDYLPPRHEGSSNFYKRNGNGANHNSSTALRKPGHISHTHDLPVGVKAQALTRNNPPVPAGNYSREPADQRPDMTKYA